MLVTCIKPIEGLTLNKEYKVRRTQARNGLYVITSDEGTTRLYKPSRFVPVVPVVEKPIL